MHPTRPTPAFATGGSFQALSVDNLDSSESEQETTRRTEEHAQKKPTPKKNKKANSTPAARKKAKNTTPPTAEPAEPAEPATAEPTPEPNGKHALTSLAIPSSEQLDTLPLSHSDCTPATSPSISTTTASAITSPSTTEFDDQEVPPAPATETSKIDEQSPQPAPSDPHPLNHNLILTAAHAHAPPTTSPQPSSTPTPTHQSHHHQTLLSKSDPASSKALPDPAEISQFGADHTPGKKWQTVLTRVFWSLVMVAGFITLMALGHVYLIILVFIIQLLVFREVTNLFQVGYKASAREHAKTLQAQSHHPHPHHYHHQKHSSPNISPTVVIKERKKVKDVGHKNRFNKLMSWYFFGVANYFLYGESIIYYFKHIVFIDEYLIPFARHHRFISLLMYLLGFLGFVTNLDRGHLRRQFGLFSWIHMSLLLIIVFGQFMVNNILEGLIWFWVPASLVIMNDVAAYVFGMLFGKHQLIKLSPKKTVEGFIGGFFMTVIFGVLWGSLFMGWNYMICPVKDLGMTAFSEVRCKPNEVFEWRRVEMTRLLVDELRMTPIIPDVVARLLPTQLWWAPFQLHCLVLATFAGLVAPFGGFFASGFKRAFNIKDFGHTIPGHGGLTDRFDCQFIMGVFTYFYYSSMVKEDDLGLIRTMASHKLAFTVPSLLQIILAHLTDPQQLQLFAELQNSLADRGLLPAT